MSSTEIVQTGINNPSMYGYAPENKEAIKADFLSIIAHGFTCDRALKLLHQWATIQHEHYSLEQLKVIDGGHPSYGRAIPARKTFYMWRRQDKEFDANWTEAMDIGTECLEDHATDMAFAGSEKLLMFLLKARNPQKYANFGVLAGSAFQINITQTDEGL